MEKFCRKNGLVLLLLVIGIAVRLWQLGAIPWGLNQDEAYAGYEAWSLLHYGVDSWGYANPCYLTTWGSGMSILESRLAIPFVALMGLTPLAVRLPQAIVACLTLPAVYGLMSRLFGKRAGLLGLGFAVICPWHIILSRWALDATNLAPGMLVFALYCLVRGLDNPRWLPASALFFGLCLYCYAIAWAIIPLTLCTMGAYLLYTRKLKFTPWLAGAAGVIVLMALPLLLFVAVNTGLMEEIRTTWISIPKMPYFRAGEMNWKNLFSPEAYLSLGKVVFGEGDGLIWNTLPGFGMFYPISWPLIVAGMVRGILNTLEAGKRRGFAGEGLLLAGGLSAALVCVCLPGANTNRTNLLHFYLLFFLALGVDGLFSWCKAHPVLPRLVIGVYVLLFGAFLTSYFGEYNQMCAVQFRYGLGEAVAFTQELDCEQVRVDQTVPHSLILFYDQTPQPEFAATVKYANYPSPYLSAASFGRYVFGGWDQSALEPDTVYLFYQGGEEPFLQAGFQVASFGVYRVAYQE